MEKKNFDEIKRLTDNNIRYCIGMQNNLARINQLLNISNRSGDGLTKEQVEDITPDCQEFNDSFKRLLVDIANKK